MPAFTEGRLQFGFDDRCWRVLQWDKQAVFLAGLHRMQHTGAVDFLGILQDADLYFIEVKDLRDHRIENKARPLAHEIACKVRDTIASAVWACDRRPLDDVGLARYLKRLFLSDRPCRVILWLEEDRPDPALRSALAEGIKRTLRWLSPRVLVMGRGDRPLTGLEVTGASP